MKEEIKLGDLILINQKGQHVKIDPVYVSDDIHSFIWTVGDLISKAYGKKQQNTVIFLDKLFLPVKMRPKLSDKEK